GGKAKMLSQGHSEVQFVSMTPDRREILFDSNSGDIDRKHLYRVPVSGGNATPVTSGNGIEWAPVMTGDNSIAYLASSGNEPAHAEVLLNENKKVYPDKNWLPSAFPKSELVEPEQIIFSASDGMRIHGQLFKPKNLMPGEKRPALLFFHGGSRRQMLLGFHHRGYYHNAYALNQYLAGRGFIVLSVNYRSGIGYGMKFREALHYGAQGASEYQDVVGAGLYLRSRDDVDPDRIGLWGGSYGGYLTAMGLARSSDLFAAGVDIHGVHDWNFRGTYNSEKNSERAQLAWRSSPLASVNDWKSPVLLIHADDDRNVPFAETVILVEHLRKLGVEYEQLIFPDDVHGFLLHENWIKAYKATADFFERKLMKK
ncbi:S9 family peptidase, partial [candidate division KSB1 bacterium]|nr:S9 family peptidase [candidate division KSB1 bacterium]